MSGHPARAAGRCDQTIASSSISVVLLIGQVSIAKDHIR